MLPVPEIQPSFSLQIGGQSITGWTGMSVSRAIERMAGEFELELTRKGEAIQLTTGIAAGQACSIKIDTIPVLKGYIDSVSISYDKDTTRIRVKGRDKTCDLIDCAASVDGPFELLNVRLEALIERVLKPYGIALTVISDTGAPFRRIAIQPGETAFELIERVCRYRAILPISDGIGGMILIKPGVIRSSGALRFGENILKGDHTSDWRDRHSLYVVKGQGEANAESTAAETAQGEGRALDTQITRNRPIVITGENQGYDMTLKQRAAWEAQFARARSVGASYTIQGWYADRATGQLWLPNTIVKIKDQLFSTNRDMLITGVTFRRDGGGTFTDLALALPEAFDLPAEKEPDDGDSQ